ncbi:MAG: SHOCT domain-containing protein [Actinomycetota bacterium]|nr:SHOCT domain-containing protein [Actinomycetota bacterium]
MTEPGVEESTAVGGAAVPAALPPMPDLKLAPTPSSEPVQLALTSGAKHSIGWQERPENKGGPCFLVARLTSMGTKVLQRFPLTNDGWEAAWNLLAATDPPSTTAVARELAARAAARERARQYQHLTTETELLVRDAVYLGGHAPDPALAPGSGYDLRFLGTGLTIYRTRTPDQLLDLPYQQIEDLEISGPGKVPSGGGFVGGGFGAAGAIEGIAIAAVLNALTTRTTIKTMLRIQAADCELFLMSSEIEPQPLRIALSRPIARIRQHQHPRPAGPAVQAAGLHQLADLLDRGLLTREEFDKIKARLLSTP